MPFQLHCNLSFCSCSQSRLLSSYVDHAFLEKKLSSRSQSKAPLSWAVALLALSVDGFPATLEPGYVAKVSGEEHSMNSLFTSPLANIHLREQANLGDAY
jgi:hypothetical protein